MSEDIFGHALALLGGSRFWPTAPFEVRDVRNAILNGVPLGSLLFFLNDIEKVSKADIARVFGVSNRSLRRQAKTLEAAMPSGLASRTWQLAEILAIAMKFLEPGTQPCAGCRRSALV